MTRISVSALALLVTITACKEKAREAPVAKVEEPAKPAAAPEAEAKPVITERESITVAGTPACAMTITYPGQVDQPVTWNGEDCTRITIAIADVARLKSMQKWNGLSDETRDDIARTAGKVLYIEGETAAAVYPLNVAGRAYEAPVAD